MDFENQPSIDIDGVFLVTKDVIDYERRKGLLKEQIPCIYEQCQGDMKIYKKQVFKWLRLQMENL